MKLTVFRWMVRRFESCLDRMVRCAPNVECDKEFLALPLRSKLGATWWFICATPFAIVALIMAQWDATLWDRA